MEQILACCGYRCDMCLAYRPNVLKNPSNRQVLSDGWYKYFGFRIPADQIMCDGCMAKDPKLIDQACPVRPCVIQRGLSNCSACDDYGGCERLAARLVVYEEIAGRMGISIPHEDRTRFIAPYENKLRLDELRSKRDE
jgi:hypothetical protein